MGISRRKFTLVEVVVALGLLSVAVFSTFAMLGVSTRSQQLSTEHGQARLAMKGKISELRALLRSAPENSNGDQMSAMLAAIGPTDVNGVSQSGGLVVPGLADAAQGKLIVVAIANEALAELPTAPARQADGSWQPGGGVGISSLDLNGDAASGVNGPVAPAATLVVPIKLLVSWRPKNWVPGQDEARVEQVFLLY